MYPKTLTHQTFKKQDDEDDVQPPRQAPGTSSPNPVIRFRRDLVPHSSVTIPTGYDTSWQASRLENYSSSPLLRLPNELLLEIMERLPPPDLYVVRQVAYLFAALFRHAAFSQYHQKKTAAIDPATAEPSVHRLLRAYRKLRGKTAPAVHFIPGVEFNVDALRVEERDSLWYALRRRTFCARCLAGRSQERQANIGVYPFYTRGDSDSAGTPSASDGKGCCESARIPCFLGHASRAGSPQGPAGKGLSCVAGSVLKRSDDTARLPKSHTIPHGQRVLQAS
ncbi:hypothetical protein CGLO_04837 [Colletotrichum gloeosporioides Cg-14]|uniref:F-box domain-containing protein n=1 Tax=Colletotrichum gloeosporioides (strain Cg-14) TaxID=1237896 RepID=T0KT17_COLGC|nr:hypothetical protein CGLO_04837 [Colletotrichum gloeosporioides Cg-14]